MAARRLVLNGLTAEVAAGRPPEAAGPPSPEFYHELELYRQLLALPVRRCRTPDPPPPPPAPRCASAGPPDPDSAPVRSTAESAPSDRFSATTKPVRYLGSFPAAGGEADRVEAVTKRLQHMKPGSTAVAGQPAVSAVVEVGVWGVRVRGAGLRMSHALRRISFATCDAPRALFAFVAREPRDRAHAHYCHAFETEHPHQAEELNALVGDAFRMAFASQLQPSAPLWSKEVSGGPRAPDSLTGLAHHYPRCHSRSPARCDATGGENAEGSASEGSEGSEASEGSPSSSEDWVSPGDPSRYRRLAERPPLMKRLALGFSGALLQPSDDDATPLVTDTPTTPTNVPLCLNGGYINEATEAARRAASGRGLEFRRGDALSNGRGGGSAAASSSSGESSGGASRESRESRGSGNNNFRPIEPELKNAPWFQQGIPREIALEVLSAQAPGAFLVRGSTTQAECLALSLRVPRDFAAHGIAHYLILRTPKGYKIKGFTKEFGSLAALVTHHSVMPELLPVPLRLPRAPPRPRADLEPLERLAPPPSPHPTPPAPPVRCANIL